MTVASRQGCCWTKFAFLNDPIPPPGARGAELTRGGAYRLGHLPGTTTASADPSAGLTVIVNRAG
jgi:hypothetical protein